MDTSTQVRAVFAELTRYPPELLDLNADLEAELGIDSVKRVEIIGELQRRFHLPEELPEPRSPLTTIAAVVAYVTELSGGAPMSEAPPSPSPSAEPVSAPSEPGAPLLALAAPPTAPPTAALMPAPAPASVPAPAAVLGLQEQIAALQAQVRQLRQSRPVQRDGLAWAMQAHAPARAQPLLGRVAFVTGSGRGIGQVIAQRIGELGAAVVVNSFHSRERGEATTAALIAEGVDAMHVWGSVAKPDHMRRMFDAIEERHGGLDFFVSNASNGMIGPLATITDEHWRKGFETNVIGLHTGALMAAPLMAKRGGGRIVAMSSPGAQRVIEHFGCQGPVKAAVESLVRYLAVELGPQNIQVNALSAGPIYGDLLGLYPDADRLIAYWEARTPGGSLGHAGQVADLVTMLLTPLAAPVSGSVLLVDGAGTQRV